MLVLLPDDAAACYHGRWRSGAPRPRARRVGVLVLWVTRALRISRPVLNVDQLTKRRKPEQCDH
jgi:hypothetical protein